MSEHKAVKFAIVIAFQILLLAGLVLARYAMQAGGAQVMLRIVPDAAAAVNSPVKYDISTVPSYNINEPIAVGETVFVPLSVGNPATGEWNVSGFVVKKIPDVVPAGTVYIRGKVMSLINSQWSMEGAIVSNNTTASTNNIVVEYGIEKLYSLAKGGETHYPHSPLVYSVAKVWVNEGGAALISQVYINNQPWP